MPPEPAPSSHSKQGVQAMHAIAMPQFNASKKHLWKTSLGALLPMMLTVAVASAADSARTTTTLAPNTGRLVVDVHGVPPPAPVFFSATVDQIVRLNQNAITGEHHLKLR